MSEEKNTVECVCTKTCQARINGVIVFVRKGEVVVPDEITPETFEALEAYEIDFENATEETLTATKWTFDEAFDAVKEAFDVELKKEEGTTKSDVIKQILDARYRQV